MSLKHRIGRLAGLVGRVKPRESYQAVSVLAEDGPPAELREVNPWLRWLILRVPPGTPAGASRRALSPEQEGLIAASTTVKVLLGIRMDDLC